eukprot:GAHX01000582.1.p1 GENE.GAHX01000582.1~~GAHX01000582.1.p1  ORF type:complete len:301 (-),score=40.63 GAHX01000582.1:41-943(-)
MNTIKHIFFAALITRHIFNTNSSTQYPKTELEPYSIVIKTPIPLTNPQQYSIAIYIVFGRHKYKPYYHDQGTSIDICGTSRCIFAISICIKFTASENDFKFILPNSDPPIEVVLDDILGNQTRQEEIVELFPDILREGQVEEVLFTTNPGDLDTLTSPINNMLIFLKGVLNVNNQVLIEQVNLIEPDGGNFVMGDGSPAPPPETSSFYGFSSDPASDKTELVTKFNCKFNRMLAFITFCNNKYFNIEMCSYYWRLIKVNLECGKELKTGVGAISIHGNAPKVVRIIWEIMKWVINRLRNN